MKKIFWLTIGLFVGHVIYGHLLADPFSMHRAVELTFFQFGALVVDRWIGD